MMKKQLITKNDIRRDLLAKINKAKKLSIFLTIIIAVAIPAYILFIINYANITAEYTDHHLAGRGLHPALGLFITPIVILFFVIFLIFSSIKDNQLNYSDWLTFVGSYLGFAGSVILGYVAIYQNRKEVPL